MFEDMWKLVSSMVVMFLICVVLVNITDTAYDYFEAGGREIVEEEMLCTVDGKDKDRRLIGKVWTTRYYITVHVSDCEELSDEIMVSSSLYGEIEVGDEVKCMVTYTEDKLIGIELIE